MGDQDAWCDRNNVRMRTYSDDEMIGHHEDADRAHSDYPPSYAEDWTGQDDGVVNPGYVGTRQVEVPDDVTMVNELRNVVRQLKEAGKKQDAFSRATTAKALSISAIVFCLLVLISQIIRLFFVIQYA